MEPVVKLNDLTLRYGRRTLVEGVDITFRRGEFTALVGRNGTGKSTLLRAIAGLGVAGEGTIEIDGRDIESFTPSERASTVAFVSTERVRIANLKVRDVVAMGRTPYTDWIGRLTPEDEEKIDEAIRLVGLERFVAKCMDTLSDGERQRAMIARALAQQTPVILLDEPTAFLDVPGKYETSLLLRRLAREQGRCIICSTHDLGVALEVCDNVALICSGRMVCMPVGEMVESGLLRKLFDDTDLDFDPRSRKVVMKGGRTQ